MPGSRAAKTLVSADAGRCRHRHAGRVRRKCWSSATTARTLRVRGRGSVVAGRARYGFAGGVCNDLAGSRWPHRVVRGAETRNLADPVTRRDIAEPRSSTCADNQSSIDHSRTAIEISNRYAPEHLILQIRRRARVARSGYATRARSSLANGRRSPLATIAAAPITCLPTYGFAAAYSGLGVDQFRRSMTVQEATRAGLDGLAPTVVALAELEGLDAHAAAVTHRLGSTR